MNFNTKASNPFPFAPEINCGISESLNSDWIKTERVENSKSKSELEIIYIGENIVINLKQKDNKKSFLGL